MVVRGILDADIFVAKERVEQSGRQAQLAAQRYLAGTLSRDQWEAERQRHFKLMAKEVKGIHLANLAAAKGGFHALTPADFGRAGQKIRKQYEYLNKFSANATPELMAMDQFVTRNGLYMEAGRGTYEETRLVEDRDNGLRWEFNVLELDAHHCVGANSCPTQTKMGVVRTGTLRMIGQRACRVNDKCNIMRYRTKKGAIEARRVMV
jgi:hypothetical protein